ncbi:MAG: hypothetical protein RI580_18330, partial [Halothece sp. Uz-M2-17]|nr:hypothetical protein [Halothece sp. Uz-M2-17]
MPRGRMNQPREIIEVPANSQASKDTMIELDSIGMWIGIISGVFGVLGGVFMLLRTYRAIVETLNHFRTNDALTKQRMQSQDRRIERLDGDIQDHRKETLSQFNILTEQISHFFSMG